jgi:hypothetical protein
LERAGDKPAQSFCLKRVNELRTRALNLSERFEAKNELSEEDQAKFYSSWIYTALRLLSATEKYSSEVKMSELTGLPLASVRKALHFLVSRGLSVEVENRIKFGPTKTYLESHSPLVATHHLNWRRKSSEQYDQLRLEDLVYTYPVVLSEKDFLIVREKIVLFIEEIQKLTAPSPSEQLYCLNIDWLRIFP